MEYTASNLADVTESLLNKANGNSSVDDIDLMIQFTNADLLEMFKLKIIDEYRTVVM